MLRNRALAAVPLVGAVIVVAVALASHSDAPREIDLTPAPETSGLQTPTDLGPVGAADLGAPSEVDGLQVLSVDDALIRRHAGSTDRVAVFGWAVWFAVPCPQPPDAYQPLESCIYRFTWLMAAPEQLGTINPDGTGSIRSPIGAAFNTTFEPSEAGVPEAVIVIGRFHDPRSTQCPAGARRDACERLFVAEAAAWVGPTSTAAPSVIPAASSSPQPSGAS
jgi:hypothetical protein